MDLARLILGVDTRQLRDGERDMRSFGSTARGVAATVGAAFAAIGFANFGRQSIQAAIDAEEMGSAFNVVFGDMANDVRAWAEETSKAMNRSSLEMMRGALAFQELFGKALAPQAAAEMSKQFAVLTQDLASFKNLSEEVAQQKLFSGLVGEAEPLRAVGVFLSEAAVQAKGLELGLSGVNDELTDQEKIVARAAIIQEQLAQASGDVIRTSDSAANQIRGYEAAVLDLQVAIGQGLLPTFTPLITGAADIIRSMAEMSRGFVGSESNMRSLWNTVTTVVGAWAAYRVTLLAVSAAQAAYTAAMVIGTRVIGAAQAATLGLNAALLANPFTAVASAVGILTGAFIALANSQRQAKADTDNLIVSLKAAAQARSADFMMQRNILRERIREEEKRLTEMGRSQAPISAGPFGAINPFATRLQREQLAQQALLVGDLRSELNAADRAYQEAGKAADSIVVPTGNAAAAVGGLGKELRGASGSAIQAADDFQRLYDRLYPYQAMMRQFDADAAALARRLSGPELDEALNRLERERIASRVGNRGPAPVSQGLLNEGPLVQDLALDIGKTWQRLSAEVKADTILKETGDVAESLKVLKEDVKTDTVTIAESFAQMSRNITSSLQGLANSIRSGDILGILGGVLDIFTSLGSAGVFGKGLQTRLNQRSFDGGGYTGSGSRSGGLDGKGGFLAMLHPNETVIDHHRGQRVPANDTRVHVTVGIDQRNGNVLAFVDGRIAATAPIVANAGAQQAMAQSAAAARRRVR